MKKIIFIVVAMVIVGVGGYFIFKKPVTSPIGQCGDNICDEFEKANPDACPTDCLSAQSSRPAQSSSSRSSNEAIKDGEINITIDVSQSLGKFSPYLFGYAGSPKPMTSESINLARSAGYKLVITSTQIGDGTKCDDSIINSRDKQIDELFKAGIEPMPQFDPLKKPANLDIYAACVKKAGKHLFDKGVRIFRFSNEPDGNWTDWGKKPNQSDPIDVAQTYEAWAKALKSVDKSIVIEGPAIMILTEKGQIADWVKKFLNYLSEHSVPLDIFSFHIYSASPYEYYKKFNMAKEELRKHKISPLYGVPKLGNDEWLMKLGDLWNGSYSEEFDTTWAATAQLNGLINMIEEGAVLSVPTFGIDTEQDTLCHDFLPVSCNGKAKPVFYAFQAFNQLAETNQLKISGTDRMNFAAIPGIKELNGEKQIIIILSNYDVSKYWNTYSNAQMNEMIASDDSLSGDVKNAQVYGKFELNIKNTPWKSSEIVTAKRYLIDDNNAMVLAEKNGQSITVSNDGSVSLSADISAPQIQIITLATKNKPSLFSLDPVLPTDENYGKLDIVGKKTFNSKK